MNFSLRDELISENGYILRMVSASNWRWIDLLLKPYRFVGRAYRAHSILLLRARESDHLFFCPNIDD